MMRIVIHEMVRTRASGTDRERSAVCTVCGMMEAIVRYHMMQ